MAIRKGCILDPRDLGYLDLVFLQSRKMFKRDLPINVNLNCICIEIMYMIDVNLNASVITTFEIQEHKEKLIMKSRCMKYSLLIIIIKYSFCKYQHVSLAYDYKYIPN